MYNDSNCHGKINDISKNERPRERLLNNNAQSLSNRELLAIIISCGTQNHSALELANDVIKLVKEDISQLSNFRIEELCSVKGIGPAIACKIIASIELGKRINSSISKRTKLDNPSEIASYCSDLSHNQKETFRILIFNVKLECIGESDISIGNINSSYAEPREIFSEAIRRAAYAIALVHNHPSGDPSPSFADIETTKQLVECSKLLGIRILDHVIVAENRFYSFKNENLILD